MTNHRLDGVRWRKSTRSNGNGGNCVEVADLDDGTRAVRDSKAGGTGPTLFFTPREWAAFLDGVRLGEFD